MKIKKKEEKPQLKEAEITNEDLGELAAHGKHQEAKQTPFNDLMHVTCPADMSDSFESLRCAAKQGLTEVWS